MSLLRQYGHMQPEDYALGILASEVDMLSERLGQDQAQRMILDRQVLTSLPNQAVKANTTRSAFTAFTQTVKGLMSGNGKG